MEIYTIGHTKHKIEYFIYLLHQNKINCIVDVRSTPFSKFTPQYNKDILRKELNMKGIHYIHMGKEFGARRDNKLLYNEQGYLDFEKTRRDKDFLIGVDRLIDGCNKGFKIALMCTEKDPFDCHRSIMVSKGLVDRGFTIKHIIPESKIQTQEEIEKRLLDKYFENRFQISMDSLLGEQISEQEMIEEAYRRRNKEIGYELSEGK